ncbi:hypothetical protein Ct61P_06915 [Colletotrichum tofieldiae]|nr:hypothetical protein Ct61P_06915 [Colletotrichum tofieldiae]
MSLANISQSIAIPRFAKILQSALVAVAVAAATPAVTAAAEGGFASSRNSLTPPVSGAALGCYIVEL